MRKRRLGGIGTAAVIRLLALVLLLAVACGRDPSGPQDDYELPPPDLRLDPALLTFGDTIVRCGQILQPPADAAARLLIDVYFASLFGSSELGASETHAQSIESLGGKVLIGFPFPALRVRLTAARLTDLTSAYPHVWVFTVPNAARYDWPDVSVRFSGEATTDDSLDIVALGGRVGFFSRETGSVLTDLPAISVTPLRQRARVNSVSPGQSAC